MEITQQLFSYYEPLVYFERISVWWSLTILGEGSREEEREVRLQRTCRRGGEHYFKKKKLIQKSLRVYGVFTLVSFIY